MWGGRERDSRRRKWWEQGIFAHEMRSLPKDQGTSLRMLGRYLEAASVRVVPGHVRIKGRRGGHVWGRGHSFWASVGSVGAQGVW